MYQGTYDSTGWTGDLKAYKIETDGSVDEDDPVWSAAKVLNARVAASGHGDRDIYTMGASSAFEFIADKIGSLTEDQQYYLGDDAAARTNLVNYIRGSAINGFRSRLTRLGDIVHSEPKFVNGYLYAGANDGMFHVFDASDGQEVFAYIPSFVYPNLEELSNPDYSHRYFVDSTAFIGYYDSDVLLISGLGKGGKGYFCLDIDITNPGSFTAADVKWEYPDTGSSNTEVDNLGYTFSEPIIINTETAGEVLIFSNGYDSPNARAVLYALDPSTGNMLKMVDTEYGSPDPADDNCNGLSTPVFIDSNNNGKADSAYAGDLRGNVWKFDISGAVADWHVAYASGGSPKPLFQARDSDGHPQPITTRLAVRGHCVRGYSGYIVTFGTGKFNAAGDFTSTSTQAVYGVWDWAAEWDEEDTTGDSSDKYLGAFNDPNGGNLSNLAAHSDLSGVGSKLTLVSQSQSGGTAFYGGKTWGFTSSNDINWFNVASFLEGGTYGDDADEGYHVGWTYALPNSGERVVADPVLWLDYVLIVSQEPTESVCTVGGVSYLTALNICSGAAPDEPFFDTNGDGEITDDDLIDGEPPGTIELDDFITYPPTMVEDFIYFGPGESYVVDTDPSRVIFWRFLNLD
jgi:type IV pilus assembly protein PilY1